MISSFRFFMMIRGQSILKQLLYDRQSIVRSIVSQADYELGCRMKKLNDGKQYRQAIELFDQQKDRNIGHSSSMIITQFLKACAHTGDLQRASMIRATVDHRIANDTYILASFIHLYMQCGDVTNAELLFQQTTKKTQSIYGAMMKGYLKNNKIQKVIDVYHEIAEDPDEVIIMLLFSACARLGNADALKLMKKVSSTMPRSFRSNSKILNTKFDALIKCGDLSSAEQIFSAMKRSVVSYGNMMNAFNQDEQPEKTLELFHRMKSEAIELNSIICLCVINALAQTGITSLSQSLLEQIPQPLLLDLSIRNALIDMWGKNGAIDRAKQLFQAHPRPDKFTYTAMINAFAVNGMGIEALEVFKRMPSQFADEVAYLCVLNACSHAGLIDQARLIFEKAPQKTFKIYTAMVDCFSRAACFQEAEELIAEYERTGPPIYPMYMTLLSGARHEKNTQLSQKIFDRMSKLFPESVRCVTSASVLLANVYASSGHLNKAQDIHSQLSGTGQRKEVGLSWTAAKGQLCRMINLILKAQRSTLSWITRRLKESETAASVLCGHSERLAIAWNFVVDPQTTQIQVTKNLRVCGDCHAATKLIAKVKKCNIVVRDAHRIHHFYPNGQCSCQDYF